MACWISPAGDIIGVHGSHTSTVIEAPETFGLSGEDALSLFNTGEELSVLRRLVNRNWIRIRYQAGCFYVSVKSLLPNTRDRLQRWALLVINSSMDNSTVIIEELSSSSVSKVLLKSISMGNFSHNESLSIISIIDYEEWSLISGQCRKIKRGK